MSGGTWARELGDSYAAIALTAETALKAEANANEAAKYYGIADRMDRVLSAREER